MPITPAIRFRALDSLRGLAAVIVMLNHTVLSIPEGSQGPFLQYIGPASAMGGRFAVMLFFVLSGFVLALPYFAGTNSAYGPYLVRRFCRVYPPFAFAVLVAALLCHLLGGRSLPMVSAWPNDAWSSPVTWGVVLSHLLMTGIHFSAIRLDSPAWSLIIEMRVSIIFPLLVLYVRRFGWSGVAAALVAAFACAKARAALGETSLFVAESLTGTILLTGRYAALFFLGVIVAARLDQIKEMMVRVAPKLHGGIFIGMVFILMMVTYMKEAGIHIGYVDMFFGMFTMYLIVLCVTFPRFAKHLSGSVSLWLGDISYSLYLIHTPVLLAVFYLLNGRMSLGGMIALALPAMLIAGHVMHYLIERPSMIVGRKLARAIR